MALTLEERPTFIIGHERSGTTMLMLMIGSHPRIAVPEVTWYYPRFRPYLFTYGDLGQEANFRTLAEEMIFGLMVPFFGLKANPRTVVDEILAHLRERSFSGIFDAVVSWYARSQGKPRWGEKTPNNLFFIEAILEDFPNAQFVYITRDGRDCAAEYIQSAFGPTNAFAAAEGWKLFVATAGSWRSKLDRSRWLDLRYETLVREPEPVLRALCDFLGEKYSPAMLEFHRGSIAQARSRSRDHRPLGHPVSDRYVGIYRQFLSLHEQRIFAAVAGRELAESGYEVEVEPAEIAEQEADWFREVDGRVRAAILDATRYQPWAGGGILQESYNDWLVDQREERRRRGIWSEADRPDSYPIGDPNEEHMAGIKVPRRWKDHFGIKRKYGV